VARQATLSPTAMAGDGFFSARQTDPRLALVDRMVQFRREHRPTAAQSLRDFENITGLRAID
jgi:hypothetical protein